MAKCNRVTRRKQTQGCKITRLSQKSAKERKKQQNKQNIKKTKKKQISVEERLKKKRDAAKVRRLKIKNDPIKYKAACAEERERWKRRKELGKIKTISEMTNREKRHRRNIVRKSVRAHRERKKLLNEKTLSDDGNPIVTRSRRTIRRRKLRHLKQSKKFKELQKLKKKNALLQRKIATYRKAKWRQNNKENNQKILSPRSTVNRLLKNNVSDEIKKRFEAGEVLRRQIKEIYKTNKDYKSKQIIRKIIAGTIVKKHRMCNRIRELYVPLRPEKNADSNNLRSYKRKTYNSLKLSLQRTVTYFFEENSRMCPGKKDFISYRGVKKQKMFLNDNVEMLWNKFRNTYPSYSISYSLFATMKPFWTVSDRVSDRDTCLCTKHENINLLIKALHQGHVIDRNNPTALLESITCSPWTENCLQRLCPQCFDKHIVFSDVSEDKLINVEEWIVVKENRNSFKTKQQICVQRTVKRREVKSIGDLKQKLQDLLDPFMNHVMRMEHQYKAMKHLKLSLTECDVLLHIDFSENFNCKYASEPQSVHFGASRESITLHTGIWYTKGNHQAFCTISKSLRHDPPAVIAHLVPILKDIFDRNSKITHVNFLSDGPTNRYRKKVTFALFTTYLVHEYKQIKKISYNFTESGHGKGAPDGIGGAIKRTADQFVAHGKDVDDFDAFYSCLKQKIQNIYCTAVLESEIAQIDEMIPKNLKTFVGTMKMHQWNWKRDQPNAIMFNTLSCYDCNMLNECVHFHLGKWAIIPEKVFRTVRPRSRN